MLTMVPLELDDYLRPQWEQTRIAFVSGPLGFGKSAFARRMLRRNICIGRGIHPPYIQAAWQLRCWYAWVKGDANCLCFHSVLPLFGWLCVLR